MKIFREKETATIPHFATKGSACFDLSACLEEGDKVVAYNPHNRKMEIPVRRVSGNFSIQLHPGFRTLIPTGLIFDIPTNHVLKLFIRSSMALKYGLTLANSTAIIDSDYVEQTYILVHNTGDTPVVISHGERIAQGMLEKLHVYDLNERKTRPTQKTDRDGGMGSTGV